MALNLKSKKLSGSTETAEPRFCWAESCFYSLSRCVHTQLRVSSKQISLQTVWTLVWIKQPNWLTREPWYSRSTNEEFSEPTRGRGPKEAVSKDEEMTKNRHVNMKEETRAGEIWKMSHGLVGQWRPMLLYGQRNIAGFCATQTCWRGWSCLFGSDPLMHQVFFFLLVFNLPGQYVFSRNTTPNEQLSYLPVIVPVVHSTFKPAVCKRSKANRGLKSFNMLCPIKPNPHNCPGGKEDIGVYPCTRRPLLSARKSEKLWRVVFPIGSCSPTWLKSSERAEKNWTDLWCILKSYIWLLPQLSHSKKCPLSGSWHKGFCLNGLHF